MSSDRLTEAADLTFADIEALIAGELCALSPRDADAEVDLAEALDTYHAAGRAALRRRDEQAWFQARITPTEWAMAEEAFAFQIAPKLDETVGVDGAWWFLRKYPCWRIRVRTSDHAAMTELLNELVANGAIASWRAGIYEPEAAAFGGMTAMRTVHDLFYADSRGVVAYTRQGTPELGRRELSLLLLRAMHQQAGLDWFESGDVFAQVGEMRPIPDDADTARTEMLATRMKPLLHRAVCLDTVASSDIGRGAYIEPWLSGFNDAGRKLGEAATNGSLDRGLRAVLAQVVIFHWNRLGLSAPAQSILAHAAKTAFLPSGS
ncbi:thiopeptide-type bacteriocin biosynthesis protein [Actinoplanes missouriensis]|uniref:thiopeptide-type bacteriocin biosynthesis protein n=1 Tax=Actinoplanes missouriensis TaxID=1866 RepID=UPI0034119D4E